MGLRELIQISAVLFLWYGPPSADAQIENALFCVKKTPPYELARDPANPSANWTSKSTADKIPTSICGPSEKLTIVAHGLQETIDTPWVLAIAARFQKTRGGCVCILQWDASNAMAIATNYQAYGQMAYDRVMQFYDQKFDIVGKTVLAGFSLGVRIWQNAAQLFNDKDPQKLRKVWRLFGMEPAGNIYDNIPWGDPTAYFIYSECFHTSTDNGTPKRVCNVDALFGNACGSDQPFKGSFPFGNHGLCPYITNSTFTNCFPSVTKTTTCPNDQVAANATRDTYVPGLCIRYNEAPQFPPTSPGKILYAKTACGPDFMTPPPPGSANCACYGSCNPLSPSDPSSPSSPSIPMTNDPTAIANYVSSLVSSILSSFLSVLG